MRLLNWLQSAAVSVLAVSAANAQEFSGAQEVTPTSYTAPSASSNSVIPASAASYASFHGEAADLGSRPLTSQQQVEEKLDKLGGQNTSSLTSGWMSYSALVAAQNREFVASVRDIESYYGRERLMAALEKNPGYVITLDGGDKALQSALAASEADARNLSSTAAFMESQESNLQNQSWMKERIRDGKARAARLETLSQSQQPVSAAARQLFSAPDIGAILSANENGGAASVWARASRVAGSAPLSAFSSISPRKYSVKPTYTQTANHMASLAAYEVIGEATPAAAGVRNAMNDRKANDCFNFAQLQLRGCVASQSDHYGLQACLREHAISDVGNCVGDVAQ